VLTITPLLFANLAGQGCRAAEPSTQRQAAKPAVRRVVRPTPKPTPKKGRKTMIVYIGTYSGKEQQGIRVFRLDAATGTLAPLGGASGVGNPSFVALHPNGRFLFAVGEVGNFDAKGGGAVAAFATNPETGVLKMLNEQSSGGGAPCHLSLDPAGKNVFVANYGGGSIACLPVGRDGWLHPATAFIQHTGSSVNKERQGEPHAHSINADAAGRFVVSADLGLDKLLVYRLDADKGKLTPNDPPAANVAAGAGPRHFAFHPNGRFAVAVNELNSTITALRYDASRGTLAEIQTLSTLPAGFEGTNYPAEVLFHPSGKFVYASNRGHDSLAIFGVDAANGHLRLVGHQATHGKTPRGFGLSPSGDFLIAANQETNTLIVFRVDPATGRLTQTGAAVAVPHPVCVVIAPPREAAR